jgi:hypothetical protein
MRLGINWKRFGRSVKSDSLPCARGGVRLDPEDITGALSAPNPFVPCGLECLENYSIKE